MSRLPSRGIFTKIEQFSIDYKQKVLGTGSFGVVRLAIHKGTMKKFAVKIIQKDEDFGQYERQLLDREIRLHFISDHPQIIKLWDVIETQFKIYMILEYAANGNLFFYHLRKGYLSESQVFKIFYQSLLAIDYLHSCDVFHRDIKPQNILLDHDFNVKLCDFGWATSEILKNRKTFCGTYEYMSPEMIRKQQYNYKIDIWALGVLLYELTHNSAPFPGQTFEEVEKRIQIGQIKIKSSLSPLIKQLIKKILQFDSEKRPTTSEIKKDQWIQSTKELLMKQEHFQCKANRSSQKLGNLASKKPSYKTIHSRCQSLLFNIDKKSLITTTLKKNKKKCKTLEEQGIQNLFKNAKQDNTNTSLNDKENSQLKLVSKLAGSLQLRKRKILMTAKQNSRRQQPIKIDKKR